MGACFLRRFGVGSSPRPPRPLLCAPPNPQSSGRGCLSQVGEGYRHSNDLAALLLALAAENAELRQQLATPQDLLMETAIDAGHLHARIEAVQAERDARREEAFYV